MMKAIIAAAGVVVGVAGIIAASLIVSLTGAILTAGTRNATHADNSIRMGDTTTHLIEVYPGLSPYDERQNAHPYNPGPKIIYAPIPKRVTNHKNLHLPDPVCLAGCIPRNHNTE